MRRILYFFIVLFFAILLGLVMYQSAGYVLIAFQNWTIETTLWIFVFLLLLLLLLLNFLLQIINGIISGPGLFKNWVKKRKINRARKQTNLGLYAWLEGKWAQAERLLFQGTKKSDLPLINLLFAAKAAHKQVQYAKRDAYLQLAQEKYSKKQIAIGLIKARFLLEEKEFAKAVGILNYLHQISSSNVQVTYLLQKAYFKAGDWSNLYNLLPVLAKYKILPPDELTILEQLTYKNILMSINKDNHEELIKIWHEIPQYLRVDVELLLAYCKGLMSNADGHILAEKTLRHVLKTTWDDRLIEQYGLTEGSNHVKQLAFAESFLIDYQLNSSLFLCLGRLCKKQKLWGKAQSYLETSIRLRESKTAYQELGKLTEELGNRDMALNYYRKALEMNL